MTKEDIIRMAREAGGLNCDCCLPEPEPHEMQKFIERFAALVAAHERDECAKVCEDSDTWDLYDPNGFAANLIRARGEKC
jgi:hypothetical protein